MTDAAMIDGALPRRGARLRLAVLGLALVPLLGGCITVKAPEKPIVVQLDMTIKQDVTYRLAEDAKSTVEDNPAIF